MCYYHVRITQKSKSRDETKVDFKKEGLRLRILDPYEYGDPIVMNGKTIPPDDIERIRISRSEERAKSFYPEIKRDRERSKIIAIPGPSMQWEAAARAKDMTDELIKGPPGHLSSEKVVALQSDNLAERNTKKVFIVHGRDEALKTALELFLQRLGLDPIVLHRQADEGLTIIEKLERHSNVAFAFILLTADDVGAGAAEFEETKSGEGLEPRARQNVIFEWGFFVGRLGRENVVCLYEEEVELPSDVSGLLYKPIKKSLEEVKWSLVEEIQHAGLEVQLKADPKN